MTEKPQFYGRRKGKPLRPGRRDLMDTLLPRVRFDAFPEGREAWLEIGFGGGEHVAGLAAANPGVAFIAGEVFSNGIASMLAHIERLELKNVLIIPEDIRLFWNRFPSGSIAKVFLLFPDPWPKTRHARRRFVNPENIAELSRIMASGAEFHVASDCGFYIDWAMEIMVQFPWFTLSRNEGFPPENWVATRYEGKAIASGRTPRYLTFVKEEGLTIPSR